MLKLAHEEYIVDESGKRMAVILSIAKYQKILEALEDLADSRYIKAHRKEKSIPLDVFLKQLQEEKLV